MDGLACLSLSRFLHLLIAGRRHWLVLLFLACAVPPLSALPTIDSEGVGYVDMDRVAEFSVQPRSATFADVGNFTFQNLRPGATLDAKGEALWLRFRLVNRAVDTPFHWVFHHQSSQLDELSLWTRDDEGAWLQQQVSDRKPFHQRQVAYRKPALAHLTPPLATTEAVVRMTLHDDRQLTAATHLWEWTHFNEYVQLELLLNGVYYGVMLTLMFLALLFAVALRDDSLLHYGLFVLATALLWGVHTGLGHQYLWPGQVRLHNESYHLAFLVFAISALQLAKSFLRTRQHLPVLHWSLGTAQAVAALGVASRLAGFQWPPIDLYNLVNMVVLSLLPLAAWVAHHRGVERVRWFAVGWVIYALGLALA
ncbi:MAG: hypothetical protein M0R02_15870, partial [Bacteroidales bacterium]|nr:hypothetical protein [Bacteroidales bacterium]